MRVRARRLNRDKLLRFIVQLRMFHIKPPLQISDELKLRGYSQQPLDWTLSTSMALE